MANKKFIIAIIIGFSFALGTSFIPQYVDPLIRHAFIWSSSWDKLRADDEITTYLKCIQYDQDVIVGLHGYRHLCPVDNSDAYEFWDPEGKLTDHQLKTLVDGSTQIFSDVGITEYLFVPPGEAMDERAWDLFRERGFQLYKLNPIEYTMAFSPDFSRTKLERLGRILMKSLQRATRVYREYTWCWRDMTGFDDPRYEESIRRVKEEKPILILLHQQDLNQYAFKFLRELPYHPEFIRCDDFTLEVEKAKELVEIARSHNSVAILAVIPSFTRPESQLLQIWNKVHFSMFLVFFVFPSIVFLSWYSMARREKKIRDTDYIDRVKNIIIIFSALATITSIYLFTRLGSPAVCVTFSVVSGCLIGWKLGEVKRNVK